MNSLLPPSSTELERALEQLEAERMASLPLPHRTLWSPDNCPEHLLPWLAWALSVDVWRDSWPEAVKREAIRNAPDLHRLKGTAGAVKRAVKALGADIAITEWWEMTPEGEPYTFEVAFTPSATLPNDINFQQDVADSIDAAKNLRSDYDLIVNNPVAMPVASAATLRMASLLQLGSTLPAGEALALPYTLAVHNANADTDTSGWVNLTGSLQWQSAPLDYFAPGVFSASSGYTSAYQDFVLPLRLQQHLQAGVLLEYSYWTADTENAQLCAEVFDDSGTSIGVFIPTASDDGIAQVSASVSLPANAHTIRLLQQFNASAGSELFIDMITATISTIAQE